MTLPIETILPLNAERLRSGNPVLVGDYVSELVNSLTTIYTQQSQAINGDYKDFAPIVYGTSTAGLGTYSVQNGYYLRLGLIVDYWYTVAWSGHTGTGNAYIQLPYKVKFNNTDFTGEVVGQYNYSSSYNGMWGLGVSQTFRKDLYLEGALNIPVLALPLLTSGALRGHIRYIGQEIEN